MTIAPGVTVPVPTPDPPVPPDVPASRFVSPGGSDGATCEPGPRVAAFDRAYQAAQPGEVVDVAAGTYPTQRIEYDPSKTSSDDVYIRPAAGDAVKVNGDIDVYGSHVTVMAMQAEDTDIPYDGPADVSDVTFWAMDGRNFTIDSGQDVSVIGGDYGPASSCGGSYGGGNNGIRMNRPGVMPSDILIWGVDIHDVQSYDLNACHIECLIVGAGENITVRSSRFWNCSIFDIFLQPFNGSISDVTLENNWFAAPTDPNGNVNSGRAVEFSGGGPWQNLLIRHNSVNTAINLNDGAPNPQYVNTSVIGNIAERSNPPCFSAQGVVYRDNVWQQGTCDPSDRSRRWRGIPLRARQRPCRSRLPPHRRCRGRPRAHLGEQPRRRHRRRRAPWRRRARRRLRRALSARAREAGARPLISRWSLRQRSSARFRFRPQKRRGCAHGRAGERIW